MFNDLSKEYKLHPLIIVRAIEASGQDIEKARDILNNIPSYPFVWNFSCSKFVQCKLFDTNV